MYLLLSMYLPMLVSILSIKEISILWKNCHFFDINIHYLEISRYRFYLASIYLLVSTYVPMVGIYLSGRCLWRRSLPTIRRCSISEESRPGIQRSIVYLSISTEWGIYLSAGWALLRYPLIHRSSLQWFHRKVRLRLNTGPGRGGGKKKPKGP